MTKSDWMDLTVLERKKYNCLSEVLGLSQQLGEAMDRNDDVSVRMLVAMRQDPLLQLQELKRAVDTKRESLSQEDRDRLSALTQGAPPPGGGGNRLPGPGGQRPPPAGAGAGAG